MSAIKYRGRVFSLQTSQCRLPNGIKTQLDLILHPGAALILPVLPSGKIIFIRQYRPAIRRYLLELPAGTLKPGETLLNCARRELIEETGYRAQKWKKLGKIFPVPGYSTEIITLYQAEGLSEARGDQDVDEMISLCPIDRHAIRGLLRKGRVLDAKTICALVLGGWLR